MTLLVGALAVTVIAIGFLLTLVFPRILDLELVESPQVALGIVGPIGDPRRKRAERSTWLDCVFVVCYVTLIVSVSWLIYSLGSGWLKGLALLSVFGVLLTAAADVLENRSILHLLRESPMTQRTVDRVRCWALVKWGLLFLLLGGLSIPFLLRWDRFSWIGTFFALTCVVGLTDLLLGARRKLRFAGILMGFGIIATAILFIRYGNQW